MITVNFWTNCWSWDLSYVSQVFILSSENFFEINGRVVVDVKYHAQTAEAIKFINVVFGEYVTYDVFTRNEEWWPIVSGSLTKLFKIIYIKIISIFKIKKIFCFYINIKLMLLSRILFFKPSPKITLKTCYCTALSCLFF